MKVAVVGGGAFGTLTALKLAEMGQAVTLFERRAKLIQGASYNNLNRLHLGFHYPRDDETARQCLRGFNRFKEEFESCVLGGFPNTYFIASKGSLTSPQNFLAFCDRHHLEYSLIDLANFRPSVRNVDLGIVTHEVVYDSAMLGALLSQRLQRSGVTIRLNHDVTGIARGNGGGFELSLNGHGDIRFDAVVNCCYADNNRLTTQLGHRIDIQQYEYTAVPIIELDWPETVGITVMDGPFLSLLPFGKTGLYLLYHVADVVIARDDAPLLNPAWRDPATSPFASVTKGTWFVRMIEKCCAFVPALRGARLKGFLEGPRMVLSKREDTDARPSIVTQPEPGYITVFSGKIDHSVWVAEEVWSKLAGEA